MDSILSPGLMKFLIRIIILISIITTIAITITLVAPLGGSTAAQRFWSKEVCDKGRSLEEKSLEICFFL